MDVVGEGRSGGLGTDTGEGDGDTRVGGFLEELGDWGEVFGCVEGPGDENDSWFRGHIGRGTRV